MSQTATERLRKLLDERGVEWTYADGTVRFTDNGRWYRAWAYSDNAMCVSMGYLTPEQAIAATLSGGKLTAEQVRECVQHVYLEGYSDGSVHRGHGIEETDWQAIADELNATIGGGEIEIVEHYAASTRGEIGRERVKLSCGHIVERHSKFCQECGRKIREAVKR